MQKKLIKYFIFFLVFAFLAYHSVYFKKLDTVKSGVVKTFDAVGYARNFYDQKLPAKADSAVEISQLVSLLRSAPQQAFSIYSNALGIGNVRYFLVKGEGSILSVGEDVVRVSTGNDTARNDIKIATEFVYGNAIRDASGLVNLNEFNSTADFNAVSEEVNKIIRKEVVPEFKTRAAPGSVIKFTGALELNQAHLKLDSLELIPIRLSIIN